MTEDQTDDVQAEEEAGADAPAAETGADDAQEQAQDLKQDLEQDDAQDVAQDDAQEPAPDAGQAPVVDAMSGDVAGDLDEEPLPESTTGVWPVDRLKPVLEALVFAAGDPLTIKKMVEFIEGSTAEEVKATLAELSTDYLTRGIRLLEVAGGWQMRTAPEHQRYVRKLFREKPQKLTRAATETVAIIAYKQPVTRQEIETVRGVDSGGVLESLIERRLAKVVGRKDVPGRPLVYATTTEFLELFGLKSIKELPTLPELGHDFERMSDQGGFHDSQSGAILPLEEQDGAQDHAQDDTREAAGPGDEGSGPQAGDEEGVARSRGQGSGEIGGEGAGEEGPGEGGDDAETGDESGDDEVPGESGDEAGDDDETRDDD